MNDIETIQRERGWRECEYEDHWHGPDTAPCERQQVYGPEGDASCRYGGHDLPDPLADTPEGWWEFGQIIKWAHEKGWAFVLEIAAHHYCAMVNSAAGWMGNGYGDFRTAIIAALAAAVRPESEAKG